jgi:hypothetical protein
MTQAQIVDEIWERCVLFNDPDISEILKRHILTPEQQQAIDQFIKRLDQYSVQREIGFQDLKEFYTNYVPAMKRATKYVTSACTVAGAIIGYFASGKSPSGAGLGALIGGATGGLAEMLFHPLGHKMGVPKQSDVVGHQKWQERVKKEAKKAFRKHPCRTIADRKYCNYSFRNYTNWW